MNVVTQVLVACADLTEHSPHYCHSGLDCQQGVALSQATPEEGSAWCGEPTCGRSEKVRADAEIQNHRLLSNQAVSCKFKSLSIIYSYNHHTGRNRVSFDILIIH